MTRRRRLGIALVAAGLLTTLAGCPSPTPSADPPPGEISAGTSSRPSTAAAPPPAFPTNASTGLPAYAGPPAGGPASTGPTTAVRAAVDLTAAAPGIFSRVRFAVAAPDGVVYVLLTPDEAGLPQQLGIVGPRGAGFAVTGSIALPLDDAWGLHLLADGRVAVSGPLRQPGIAPGGYGFAIVDPATRAVRTTVVVPFGPPPAQALGRSALSQDGRTLYLFLSVGVGAGPRERLAEVDGTSGRVLSDRDLSNDVAAASHAPAGHEAAGLVPRPGGGVTLVVDATPDVTRPVRIPTLLTYDAQLRPVGLPVRVTSASEAAETQAVAAGVDGTVFLVVTVPGGAWILAVPDFGGAGPVLAQLDSSYDYALVVEPAQVWGVLPAPEGARAVDLTTGRIRPPVDVGCPGQNVRAMFPGSRGVGALLVGECNSPRTRTQMLWILRP